ncbi:unnamed protein product [Phytomonas sp. Hart1]|nr:unnamed protein product [Phytomonas sp. Hart1]|eukprot:CCW70384.1 unnamed protein product [Phytomonas sp. isolate Hart1]
MSLRGRVAVLIDGPAVVHRWYHRWNCTREKNGTDLDPKTFAIKNARYIIATAHSFDPAHLSQHLLSPQIDYTRTPKLNKIIVFFDNGDGGRREVYADYKKNRIDIKRTSELLLIEKVMKKVFQEEPSGTTLVLPGAEAELKVVNAEADDMIASVAFQHHKLKIPTVVMSHDYDLYQLIDEANKSYHYDIRTKHLISEKCVVNRIGVPPKLVRDFKAIAGDISDNIPGIKGIGKVRARQLLGKYGDLQGVLLKGVMNQKGHLKELLENGAKEALLSKQLVDFRMCPKISKACEKFMKL